MNKYSEDSLFDIFSYLATERGRSNTFRANHFGLREHSSWATNRFVLRKHFLGSANIFGLRKHFSWCANLFMLYPHQLGPRGFASSGSGRVQLPEWRGWAEWLFFPGRAGQPYFRCRMHTFLANVLTAIVALHLALNVSGKCDWFYNEIYFKTKDKNRWKFFPLYYCIL